MSRSSRPEPENLNHWLPIIWWSFLVLGLKLVEFLEVRFWIGFEPGQAFAAAEAKCAVGMACLLVDIRDDLTGL